MIMTITKHADKTLINGFIYTAGHDGKVAEALAIADGLIVSVGNNSDVKRYIGPETEVIDLDGRMVIPGMIDSHLHPPGKAMAELFSINLSWVASKEKLMDDIKAFIDQNPDQGFYHGRGWSISAFEGRERTLGPKKESLDQVCSKAPVILQSYDGHSRWVNSKALELAGITDSTPDPEGGCIVRDPVTGQAWGTLKGSACDLLPNQKFTTKQLREGFLAFQRFMHSFGYTGFFSAGSEEDLHEILVDLDLKKDLKMWVRDSKRIDMRRTESIDSQIDQLIDFHKDYKSDLYQIRTAKIFVDGVVESGTAKLIEPYEEALGKGKEHYGVYYWEDPELLKETVFKVNKAGFQVHIHAIGDRAVRVSLDAFEHALGRVPGEHRNSITHLQLVSAEDLPRFEQLGVTANVQAYWHFKEPGWWEEIDYTYLGVRAEKEYPLRSLLNAGAKLASSSDYSVVDYPNPLWAIKVGVTRNLSNAAYYDVDDIDSIDDQKWLLNGDERVTVKDMIDSFTVNNAYALFIDDRTGSIEPGKQADLVVLGDNLFKIDPLLIDKVRAWKTMFNGEFVYEA